MSHFCGMFRLQTIRKHQWNSRSEVQKFFANQVCLYFWSCINFALNQTGVYLVCLRIRDSNNRQCQHWIAVDTAALRLSDSMKERTESFDTVEYWNRPHILAVLQVIQVMVQVNWVFCGVNFGVSSPDFERRKPSHYQSAGSFVIRSYWGTDFSLLCLNGTVSWVLARNTACTTRHKSHLGAHHEWMLNIFVFWIWGFVSILSGLTAVNWSSP